MQELVYAYMDARDDSEINQLLLIPCVILDFLCIHPFQDGNGRVGRLIMLKECLKYNFVPIIITDDIKMFYYRGLKNWKEERGWLIDTCLSGQDRVKELLSLFEIDFE